MAPPVDDSTWRAGETASHTVDRELQRELTRARLFDGCAAPCIGRFVVRERLGAGASSVVYAAWDELLARRVAVKIFVAESSTTRMQVQREARALAKLSHRNVVPVFDVGEWNDHAFIAMELIAGTTLSQWQADPNRSTAELLDAYLQAGQGLAAAHAAGLVHRDFKPANVMVAADGRVVVTDFGLVCGIASDAATPGPSSAAGDHSIGARAAVGTPAYVAPEQRRGAKAHPSADIYSFSLCLCEALIGYHPMRYAAPAWRQALLRKARPRLYAAICTGLAEDPAARGTGITSLLDVLAPRRRRSRRRTAMLAVAGLTLVAAAIGIDHRRRNSARAEPTPPPRALFHALTLRTVTQRIDAWNAARPPRNDALATVSVRALLLEPLPTELPCPWPAPIISSALGAEAAAGLDGQGRAHGCSLDHGAVSLVFAGARCVAVGEAGAIGVIDQTGRPHVFRRRGSGWEPLRTTGPVPMLTGPFAADGPCPIAWVPEHDDEVRVVAADVRLSTGHPRRVAAVLAQWPPPGEPNVPFDPLFDVSRDGSRVLAAQFHGPLLWLDVATRAWRHEPLYFDDTTLLRTRLSPSGRRALVVDYLGRTEVRTLGGGRVGWLTAGPIVDAVFRGDDTVIAIDSDARVWRWGLASQRSGIISIHDGWVWSVANNAQVAASASEDGTIMVIERRDGITRFRFDTHDEIYKVILDGERLVMSGNNGLRMWNWRDGTPLPLADGRGLRLWDVEPATAGNGTRVYIAGAIGDAAIYLWRDTSRTLLYHSSSPRERINDVAVAADGRRAAAVTSNGNLVVIDVAAERVVAAIAAHPGRWARKVMFDATTAAIVTTGDDGYLRTWSAADGAPQRTIRISSGEIYGLDIRAGRAITAAKDGSVALIDLAHGQLIRQFRGHDTAALTAQFRADGLWFVTGEDSGLACLWRIDNDECHTRLDGHTKGVVSATFADDGTIYTSAKDGVVRFWHPTYDEPLDTLSAELARYGSW